MAGRARQPAGGPQSVVDPVAEWLEGLPGRVGGDRWRPAADVYEAEDAILIRLEVAGIPRDQIHVTIDGDLLRVRGVRRPPAGEERGRPQQVEIAFGPFERALRIEAPFLRDGIRAKLEDGILVVSLPRKPEGARKIRVERGDDA